MDAQGFGLTIGSELFLVIVPQARKAQDITTLLESHAYHGYLLNNNASIPLANTSGTWLFTDVSDAQSRVIKGRCPVLVPYAHTYLVN